MLVFAGWQTVTALSHTPAINRSLQVESASGSGILGYTEAMYDRAAYYDWIALGWQGQTYRLELAGAQGATSQQAAVREVYARIRDAATESLRHSPGRPGAWTFVATSQAALGQPQSALTAYRQWHDLAPHRASSASARLDFLTTFMAEPEGWDLALSMIDPATVEADLRILLSSAHGNRAVNLIKDPAILAFGVVLDEQP